jgi:hypothetical protein
MRALAYMHEITFTKYLEEFQRDAREYGVGCYSTYSVYFDEELAGDIAGYCVEGDRVVINKKMWQTLSNMEKWVLMYHELGHCALRLNHTSPKETDNLSRPFWNDMKDRMFRAARQEQRNKQ